MGHQCRGWNSHYSTACLNRERKCRYGHLDIARLLLQNGASVDSRQKDGWTPLAFASWDGHLDMMHLLLQNGTTVDSHANDGRTPLAIASWYGHLDAIRLLLQNG